MSKQRLNASYEGKGFKGKVSLELYIWKEDEITFVYSPALDLVGYGYNEEEAKNSFEIVLTDYIEHTHAKNTLLKDLEKLGWKIDRNRQEIEAPDKERLAKENETLQQILNSQDYHTEDRPVQLA